MINCSFWLAESNKNFITSSVVQMVLVQNVRLNSVLVSFKLLVSSKANENVLLLFG